MRQGRVILFGLSISALVLLVLVQLLLPYLAESAIARSLRRSGVDGKLRVDVRSIPAVELFAGRFDRLMVEADKVRGNIEFEKVKLDFFAIVFEPMDVLKGRAVRFVSVGGGQGTAVVTEKELNRYFAELPNARDVVVSLSGGKVTIKGVVPLGGVGIKLALTGSFRPRDAAIRFVPERISVMDAEISGFLVQQISGSLGFDIPLEGFLIPMQAIAAEVRNDRISVTVAPIPASTP